MILQKLHETGGYFFVGNETSDLPIVFATCFTRASMHWWAHVFLTGREPNQAKTGIDGTASRRKPNNYIQNPFIIADLIDTILPSVPYTEKSTARAAERKLDPVQQTCNETHLKRSCPSHRNPNLHNITNHNNCIYIQWSMLADAVSTNAAHKYVDQGTTKLRHGKLVEPNLQIQ